MDMIDGPARALPTRKPFWKYQIQCTTPNSKNREVRAVVVPDWKRKGIKVVTIIVGGRANGPRRLSGKEAEK